MGVTMLTRHPMAMPPRPRSYARHGWRINTPKARYQHGKPCQHAMAKNPCQHGSRDVGRSANVKTTLKVWNLLKIIVPGAGARESRERSD